MKVAKFLGLAISAIGIIGSSQSAHATLVPYSSSGVDMVFSSVSDITWLKNADLFGTWVSAQGTAAVFDDIVAAVPEVTLQYTFSGPETHTIVLDDYQGVWGADGRATFYGAYAFVEYLNSISYGGTDQWRLPDAINTVYPNPFPSGYVKSGDIGQLFYDELNTPSGSGLSDPNNYFDNERHGQYWSYTLDGGITAPYGFHVGRGDQYFLNPTFPFYIWPVTDGTVVPLPEPTSLLAIALGFPLIAARKRR